MDVPRQVESWRALFREAGTPERATGAKAYLKSDLHFYGVTVPFIREVAGRFHREHRRLSRVELLALVKALWEPEEHELRVLGAVLLERYIRTLEPGDLGLVEALLHRCRTWDLVDALSTRVAGRLVSAHPGLKGELRRWASDPNFWIRRAALLSLLDGFRRGPGDFPLFAELAAGMVAEKEFFIRKAIGWVLREVARKEPELTYRFLREQIARVSGLTLREGAKYLPEAQREELLRLHHSFRVRGGSSP